MVVTTDLHITGKVAQFGRGIMGDVSSKLMAQFANNLNQMIDEQGTATPAAAARRHRHRRRADRRRPQRATPAADATTARRRRCARSTAPATEPIDLMEVGGSSIVKRAVPGDPRGLLVLLLLRRRRG